MKIRNVFVVVLLLVSAVLFTLGACKKVAILRGRGKALKTIAVIPKGTMHIWWEVVRKGAEAAASERGYKTIWVGPEKETDREKQIKIVEDALSKKVCAVVLAPNDAKALVRSIEKVKELKIPCVLIDSGAETDVHDSLVATDNYGSAALAAEIMARKMGGKGKLVIIKYVQNAAGTDMRAKGFTDTIRAKFPGIEILAEQYTQGDIENARKTAEDLLMRFPETDCLYAVNQPTSIGAYKAIQNQGKEGKIRYIGFDSDPVLLHGIETGGVDSLIVQDPWKIGYMGVCAAADALAGKVLDRDVKVPVMVVDASNLEQMKKDNPEALGL